MMHADNWPLLLVILVVAGLLYWTFGYLHNHCPICNQKDCKSMGGQAPCVPRKEPYSGEDHL